MKSAKERVQERYRDVRLVRDTGNSRYYILGRDRVDSAYAKVLGKISSTTEAAAWESAAALLDPEPKEVTLTELQKLLVDVNASRGVDDQFHLVVFGSDIWLSECIAGRSTLHRSDAIAKLRKLATPEPPFSQPVKWQKAPDANLNTTWFAVSPLSGDTLAVMWRLKQEVFQDAIVWTGDHDERLGAYSDMWPTIEEAKAAVQAAHDAILRENRTETT